MERCAGKKSPELAVADAARASLARAHKSSTPRRELMRRAIWLAALYGLAQVLGLREWTSALLQGATAGPLERVGCMTYLFLYGSFVVVVPTLVIATLILTAWGAMGRKPAERPGRG